MVCWPLTAMPQIILDDLAQSQVSIFCAESQPGELASRMQMSDVVQTQFGVHLILQTDRKPGLDVKFEDIKEDVRDEYCDRMKDQIIAAFARAIPSSVP